MKTLKVGEKVPNFTVNDETGTPRSLSDYKGKKLVVFFYPKANTPGCTAEACGLRDHYKELQDAGYDLLADEDKEVINAFGVWGPKKFMGREYDGIHRKTFIVDENGIVSRVIDKVKTKDHAAQILEA